jgi:dTDP-4-dehydrorhamnose 3,5-epimerase
MKITTPKIEGLVIIEPKVYRDSRGYFSETYHQSRLGTLGIQQKFIQDNQSRSSFGVIRGLHYQKPPHAQTKLIRVIEGTIFDVALDIRPDSPTFGNWFGLEISAENQLQLLIPGGFAHGFSVLSTYATVFYKCDAYYHPESESGIRFNDPALGIDWKIDLDVAVVSKKDLELPLFKDL